MKLKESVLFFKKSLASLYGDGEAESIAKIAVEFISQIDISDFIFNEDYFFNDEKMATLKRFEKELLKSKPIQYLCNRMWFDGNWYFVNENVLIPRSETEELVELIKKNHLKDANLNIIDIGTGSGCIAISLKKHFKNATIFAMDISEKALKVAQKNSKDILGENSIQFLKNDVLKTDSLPINNFDIIVSNPPYVTQTDKGKMQKNVLNFEPHIALFESEKLEFYKKITELAAKQICKSALYFEINEYNGEDVKSLMKSYGFVNTKIAKDLQVKDRIVYSLKQGN